jgi:hypothetical protein
MNDSSRVGLSIVFTLTFETVLSIYLLYYFDSPMYMKGNSKAFDDTLVGICQ